MRTIPLKATGVAVVMALGMMMPTTGMADTSKCLKGATKFYTKIVKLAGKAAVASCSVGGSDVAFENELDASVVGKVNKAIIKFARKSVKLNCSGEDPDFVVTVSNLTASSIRVFYEDATGLDLVTLCDGIATP